MRLEGITGWRGWICLALLASGAGSQVQAGWFTDLFSRKKPLPKPEVTVNLTNRQVQVPAVVVKQGKYLELKGAIEYVLVSSGGKEYEALFTTPFSAREINQALRQIGLRGGTPATETTPSKGQPLRLLVDYTVQGKTLRCPLEQMITNVKAGHLMTAGPWTYTGSALAKDPATGQAILQASLTRSIVGLHVSDPSALVQNPRPESVTENVYAANLKALPPAGTPVRFIFERIKPNIPAGTKRALVEVTGRVTGVGYRNFTQYHARTLRLTGYVKNVTEDRVEALIEGPAENVALLLEKLRTGPHAAKVEKLRTKPLLPEGDYDDFEIQY